jgi:hypothetical protein
MKNNSATKVKTFEANRNIIVLEGFAGNPEQSKARQMRAEKVMEKRKFMMVSPASAKEEFFSPNQLIKDKTGTPLSPSLSVKKIKKPNQGIQLVKEKSVEKLEP